MEMLYLSMLFSGFYGLERRGVICLLTWEMGYGLPRLSPLSKKGIWAKIFEIFANGSDFKWLLIDTSHCQVYAHASGEKGGNGADKILCVLNKSVFRVQVKHVSA